MIRLIETPPGKPVKKIDVTISYKILELFSGHLYQSPAKAIEELVANAYDARASKCEIFLPPTFSGEVSICVWDNGAGMDVDGFEQLWKIAESSKRDEVLAEGDRKPIGKFGIGKLATYVLCHKLTYISKPKDKPMSLVTMDYRSLEDDDKDTLEVYEIDDAYLAKLLKELGHDIDTTLFSSDHWTLVIMSELKDKAREIQRGRLNWVLSSALPNNPAFAVRLNGQEITPAKATVPILKEWTIGSPEDQAAVDAKATIIALPDGKPAVSIPGIGVVHGYHELYQETITGGKSEDVTGRSHGVFVMVRGRLVNEESETFGLPPLSHQTLNRWRLVIHADGLDDYLVASREGVRKSPDLESFEDYIRALFNVARNFYETYLTRLDKDVQISTRLGTMSSGLIGRPLRNLVRDAIDEGTTPMLTELPDKSDHQAVADLRKAAQDSLTQPTKLLRDVEVDAMGPEQPIAKFQAATGLVRINQDHPFYVNFSDRGGAAEILSIVGLAEILTETYLRDAGLQQAYIEQVLRARDELLRQIVSAQPQGAIFVARRLRQADSNWKFLEEATRDALTSLGFEATRISGPGKADGYGVASIGYVEGLKGSGTYALTYDAKTTGAEKVKSGNLHIDVVALHRKERKAHYAFIVGKDFQTAGTTETQATKLARTHSVTLIRTDDLARLVEARATKYLSLIDFRDLFEKCRTPEESAKWVTKTIKHPPVKEPPLPLLLEVIWELQKDDSAERVTLGEVRKHKSKLAKYSKQEISAWLAGLHALVPRMVHHKPGTETVELHKSPEKVLEAIETAMKDAAKKGLALAGKPAKAAPKSAKPAPVKAKAVKQVKGN